MRLLTRVRLPQIWLPEHSLSPVECGYYRVASSPRRRPRSTSCISELSRQRFFPTESEVETATRGITCEGRRGLPRRGKLTAGDPQKLTSRSRRGATAAASAENIGSEENERKKMHDWL